MTAGLKAREYNQSYINSSCGCEAIRLSTDPSEPARLSDGQPDIQGLWGNVLENIASLNIEPGVHLLEIGAPEFMALRRFPGFVLDPPDGVLPHQPWALERRNQAMKEFLAPSPRATCARSTRADSSIVRGVERERFP